MLLGLLAVAGVLVAGSSLSARPDSSGGARGGDALDDGNPRVEAELLVDASELRPGQTVRVGVLFEMDAGWHVYWRNAGESGLPTELEWSFEGATVGPIQWPAPLVFQEADGFLTTYGYKDSVLLMADAVVGPRQPGRARISVVADFVTCNIGCIPGRITLSRELRVSTAGRPAPPDVHAVFERFSKRIPRVAGELGLAIDAIHSKSAIRPRDDFRTALEVRCVDPGSECAGLSLAAATPDEAFVPELLPGVDLEVVGSEQRPPDGFAIVLSGRAAPDDAGTREQRMRGVIPVSLGGSVRHVEVDVLLPRAPAGEAVSNIESSLWTVTGGFGARTASLSLLTAFGLALLGGLILNLMPCVLPILAIKVFHIAELAHESRRTVLGHGVAYTGGVLASMAGLAAVVTGLRAAGTSVGWGFQFQEPLFVAVICTLLVVFALNLFGVFEVTFQPAGAARVGADATGLRRSFFEGLLAVVLATPCTAPFLGTAVGFAFASSTPVIFAIFVAIGLGLAAPYALVTMVPGWARIVPQPGGWMLTVRKLLGFSLVATVVWLLWVVGRSVGIDAQALLLAFLVAVAFLVWVYGSVQGSSRRGLAVATAVAASAVVALGLAALPLDVRVSRAAVGATTTAAAQELEPLAWRPYNLAAIEGELRGGRPVLVDFTADWCITCKVNETVVLEDDRVRDELERLRVATFKADWTLYDEEIRQVLASFGKAGVPMYLVYRPEAPGDPEVLPELLTVDLVIDALRQAAGASGA
jgi:thiol:disulfide interchange protein/DsbC/DsbD-like thiol-disulfide interchange protein